MMIDIAVAELMASRLSHDLVGPIGAVSNGMELLADPDIGYDEEAIRLCSRSADQAAVVLRFFRLAYGNAGMQIGDDIREVRDVAARFVAHHKAELQWPAETWPAGAPNGLAKLALNMIALTLDMLPRGGEVAVTVAGDDSGITLRVAGEGQSAAVRDDYGAAFAPEIDVDTLTARNVQGAYTRLMAERLGGRLEVGEGVVFTAAI